MISPAAPPSCLELMTGNENRQCIGPLGPMEFLPECGDRFVSGSRLIEKLLDVLRRYPVPFNVRSGPPRRGDIVICEVGTEVVRRIWPSEIAPQDLKGLPSSLRILNELLDALRINPAT